MTKRLLFNDDKRTKPGRPVETLEVKVMKSTNMTRDNFYKKAIQGKIGHDHPLGVDRRMSSGR